MGRSAFCVTFVCLLLFGMNIPWCRAERELVISENCSEWATQRNLKKIIKNTFWRSQKERDITKSVVQYGQFMNGLKEFRHCAYNNENLPNDILYYWLEVYNYDKNEVVFNKENVPLFIAAFESKRGLFKISLMLHFMFARMDTTLSQYFLSLEDENSQLFYTKYLLLPMREMFGWRPIHTLLLQGTIKEIKANLAYIKISKNKIPKYHPRAERKTKVYDPFLLKHWSFESLLKSNINLTTLDIVSILSGFTGRRATV